MTAWLREEDSPVVVHRAVVQVQPAMNPTRNTNEKLSAESSDEQTRESGIKPLDDGGEITGALDLEYPGRRGLYRDVFETYVPEVADALVDTRCVRMMVELEFNLCRVESMMIELEVPAERVESVEGVRASLERELWATCDVLADGVRDKWYDTEGETEWTEASEFLE